MNDPMPIKYEEGTGPDEWIEVCGMRLPQIPVPERVWYEPIEDEL